MCIRFDGNSFPLRCNKCEAIVAAIRDAVIAKQLTFDFVWRKMALLLATHS